MTESDASGQNRDLESLIDAECQRFTNTSTIDLARMVMATVARDLEAAPKRAAGMKERFYAWHLSCYERYVAERRGHVQM